MIDLLVLFVMLGVAAAIAGGSDLSDNPTTGEEEALAIASLIAISAWLNLMVFAEWRWGRTAGKRAFGISVVPAGRAAVTWNASLVRNLLRVPDLVGLFVIAARDGQRRRLGDRAARTLVVRGRREDYEPSGAEPGGDGLSAGDGGRGEPWSHWNPQDALLGFGYILVGLFAIGGIVLGLISKEPDATLAALAVQGALFIAVPFGIARARSARPWRLIGFTAFRRSDLRLVGLAFLAQIVVAAIVSVLIGVPEQQTVVDDAVSDSTTLALVATVFAVVVIAPFAEESLFRGLFFGAVRNRAPFWVAAGSSGLLFGAAHLTTGNFVAAGLLAFFGVLLAWLYERTGSLGPPIALHALNNAIAISTVIGS